MGASGGHGLFVLAACTHERADDVAHGFCVCRAGQLEGLRCLLLRGGGHLGAHLHALCAVCSEYIGGEWLGGDLGRSRGLRWAGGIAQAGPGGARGAFLGEGGVGAGVGVVCVWAEGLGPGDLVLWGGLPGHGCVESVVGSI